jgi:hypothetical protein
MTVLVYEWDHHRHRYVTPGDRVECLKERVVAADDYVAEVERLNADRERANAVATRLEVEVERLRAAIKSHNDGCVSQCEWRRKQGHCSGYVSRGMTCHDCPTDEMIDAPSPSPGDGK